jgi:SAM-dependent methyltransferase
MHITAHNSCELFYDNYCSDLSGDAIVVDFGSYSVNGNVRDIFEPHMKYIGIDMEAGPNVDIVCENRKTPFEAKSVDVVISTSCFEHDSCFWMTFLEMCRIVKPGGYIYINAPSSGPYHGHPGDCWRFYKDSWDALQKWGVENKYNVKLLKSYIDGSDIDMWHDSVGIFTMD